ncbi:DsbA family oxidoreductase [Actinomyces minihominis]|uniref:DsbA family oxidoreductase n=1 Tax=Actinomyces minihominis TaxID=2002838 RepID=UPI000C07349D|nr:DsbA family protein [Actinomyces minihominis]
MKIELWEDIVCSWCGIANERMNEALRRFGREDEVDFAHRSFRLIDDLPEGESVNFTEYMMAQRGLPIEQVEQMAAPLRFRCAQDNSRTVGARHSTRSAHEATCSSFCLGSVVVADTESRPARRMHRIEVLVPQEPSHIFRSAANFTSKEDETICPSLQYYDSTVDERESGLA